MLRMMFHIILHSILFYSILFYSILFYSILFYSILFHSIPFHSILFHSIPFHSIPLYSIFYSILPEGLKYLFNLWFLNKYPQEDFTACLGEVACQHRPRAPYRVDLVFCEVADGFVRGYGVFHYVGMFAGVTTHSAAATCDYYRFIPAKHEIKKLGSIFVYTFIPTCMVTDCVWQT
jgi:hypothetical protein